jgi:wobble nucleotide-excising tRNase
MSDFTKIKLQGGFYSSETDIPLFTSSNHKVSLIYGINGSGKSCISNAFREYSDLEINNEVKQYSTNKLFDIDDNLVTLSDIDKVKIKVYDEVYIDKNIKIDQNALGAIVMLGEQAEFSDQILHNQESLSEVSEQIDALNLSAFHDGSANSISSKENLVMDALRSGWAVREKEIRRLARNASVNSQILERVIATEQAKESKAQLQNTYANLLNIINNARGDMAKISIDITFQINYRENEIVESLGKLIEKPGNSDLEKKILNVIEKKGIDIVDQSKNEFSSDTEICPFCYQNVDNEYKKYLLISIKNIMNENVTAHIAELESFQLDQIVYTLDDARKIANDAVEAVIGQVEVVNKIIEKYNIQIRQKVENVFTPIYITKLNLDIEIIKLQELFNKLYDVVNKYNQSIEEVEKNIKIATNINLKLSKLEIKELYDNLSTAKKQYETKKVEYDTLCGRRNEIEEQIQSLRSKMSNLNVALELINHYLGIIFGDKDRLKLELSDEGKYYVKSKRRKVHLKKLSMGERNAIALCYFFSQIQEQTSINNGLNKEFLLILDDPISSFDYDNKIGIYSFLNLLMSKVLKGNEMSRIVIFTHEIDVLLNINKVLEDIQKGNKQIFPQKFHSFRRILSDKTTEAVSERIFNNYGRLLEEIYSYAVGPLNESNFDFTIGNIMRKAIEAFATFNYNTGIESLTQDDTILNAISDQEKREYYKSRMYRLVLHNESHTRDAMNNYADRTTLEQFNKEEKIRSAKDLLAFMYLLNPKHIDSYFKTNNQAITNIRNWSNESLT